MLYLKDVEVAGKRVLVRVDYNVPLDGDRVVDDTRIRASLPTLKYLREKGAKIILCSHLGKPKGTVKPEFSLKPVAKRLSELIEQEVQFVEDCIGDKVLARANELKKGEILLLENLRFYAGEQDNDADFASKLAQVAEVYVNDAFGVAHRKHASVAAICQYVAVCCAGFLLEKELQYLGENLKQPERPFVAVLGGAKVSTKLGILKAFIKKVDKIIVGGAMANTFWAAQGFNMGNSLVEPELFEEAREILNLAREKGVKLYLPVDFITGISPKEKIGKGVCPYQEVPEEEMALDIGPATSTLYAEVRKYAKTVIWNGPMGAFENPVFAQGSLNLTEDIARVDGLTIVGGGDTDSLIHKAGGVDRFSFISTGGGSFLKFLEGKPLPALVALEECTENKKGS